MWLYLNLDAGFPFESYSKITPIVANTPESRQTETTQCDCAQETRIVSLLS